MSKVKKDERFEAKEKQQYRIINWSEYNRALENRGNVTFIIDDEVIQNWYSDAAAQRGAQEVYSDLYRSDHDDQNRFPASVPASSGLYRWLTTAHGTNGVGSAGFHAG